MVEAINRTNHETGSRVASEPLDRDLDSFTFAFWIHPHALDNLTHNLFAVGHRGGRRLPKGRNVGRELGDRVPLGRQEHLRLGLHKTLVIFLELAMSGEPLFPLVGSLPSHQAVFRLNQVVVTCGSLGFICGSLQAQLPKLIHLLAFFLQSHGRLQ
jgi:hypothetical protein